MSCVVKWNGHLSGAFDVDTGTKQGGILSPDFFALYMHDLIEKLKACGFGCQVIELVIACLFFADDLVLLSPSRYGLQQLLNICVAYCKEYCLDFNVKKSKVMIIGKLPAETTLTSLFLNNDPLDFVDEYKYLGVYLCAGKTLSFSPLTTIRSFHRLFFSSSLFSVLFSLFLFLRYSKNIPCIRNNSWVYCIHESFVKDV